VLRARKLLFGGLAGGLVAAVFSLLAFGLAYGSPGLRAAALASGMVLFFYVAGQLVMVLFADAGARTLLAVSMASYTTRVVLLGLLLLIFNTHRAHWPSLAPMAVFLTTVAVVVGWLAVEVLVFSRLRIEHFDTEYQPPSKGEFDQ
jgi:hypothetical protein